MRTETTTRTLYTFEELSDGGKQKALENLWDISVEHAWWDGVYDDAENIGLKITSFDLDRSRYCDGNFTLSACEVVANIFRDHGEMCETYKTAEKFMAEWQPVFDHYTDENNPLYESRELEDRLQDIEDEFLRAILEDYRSILQNEYEYLTSEEAILETIDANEYEFTADGRLA